MSKIVIIGAGASGMMAAIECAKNPKHSVIILEKNNRLGKKIVITGKGRCNVTNCSSEEELIEHIVTNPKFMYSAFHQFNSYDMMNFLEEHGCPLKIERGDRVFPVSDSSFDVVDALKRGLQRRNIKIHLDSEVSSVHRLEDGKFEVITKQEAIKDIDYLILATGGLSYEATGSSGDGYRWLKELGHKVTPLYPSLVGFRTKETWPRNVMGLTLKNIELNLNSLDGKSIFSERGDLLFTHKGISGPLVLKASARLAAFMSKNKIKASIDLKPALSDEKINQKLENIFKTHPKQGIEKTLYEMMPKALADIFLEQHSHISKKRNCDIIRTERLAILHWIKEIPLEITGPCGFNEAVVTQGGVDIREIYPQRMESKLISGLFILGELIDVDAYTGGYNLQIAWSSGYAAGSYLAGL